jgi:hypothetical protein
VTDIRAFLEKNIELWAAVGNPALLMRFVLNNGDVFEGQSLPPDVAKMPAKACFENAAKLTLDSDYEYYEGFGVREGLPLAVHHAWCVHYGEVIDPTWGDPHMAVYMGVHIPRDDLSVELLKNGVWGVLDIGVYNLEYMYRRDPALKAVGDAFMRKVRAA